MKRLLCLFSVIFSLLLSSCGANLVAIEDCDWKMRAVMTTRVEEGQTENDFVIAVGEADDVHPDAKIVDLTLSAKDGNLTVTDLTNGKTYDGTYKVTKRTPRSIDYEITINGEQGYATVAKTTYYGGDEIPTLPINIGEYALYFVPVAE